MGAHPNNVHILYTKAISPLFYIRNMGKFFEKEEFIEELDRHKI
jgi:hypothetical protein